MRDVGPRRDVAVGGRRESNSEEAAESLGGVRAMMSAGGNQAMVQMAGAGAGGQADDVHAAAAHGTAGGGGALPHLGTIQQAFGHHDVGGVQAHVGGQAKAASQAMGAEAYATGNHVAFGGSPDLHTAAHEAAHVVQQRAGVSLSGGVGAVGDSYERHADQVADKVVAGQSAAGLLDQFAGGGSSVQRRAVQRVATPAGPTPAPAPGPAPVRGPAPTTGPSVTTGPGAGAGAASGAPAAPPIGRGTEEADVKRFAAADSIAMQKLADVDAEMHLADVAPATAKSGFYQAVGSYINANHATLQPAALYNAVFNRAAGPYKFKGTKIPAASLTGLSARTAGVGGFWQRQVNQGIFLSQASAELGLPAADDGVKQLARAKFIAQAKAGGDLMPVLGSGMVAPDGYPAWFTPDKVRIDSNRDTAFGDLMKIFALQPEWFAEGNVFFEVDPAGMGELRKPTAYDGMQSSLWVARNQVGETYGMTGGGAREYLAQGVPISSIKSCRGAVPSDDFLAQVTRLQSRAVDKFLEANPAIKAEIVALTARVAALPDADPQKAIVKARLDEIKNWTPNLTDWVLRGQTTQLTSHIGVKIRDAKAALDAVHAATAGERATPSPPRSAPTLVNPAPGGVPSGGAGAAGGGASPGGAGALGVGGGASTPPAAPGGGATPPTGP